MKVKLDGSVEKYPCLSVSKDYEKYDEDNDDVYEVPDELIEKYLAKEKELYELEDQIRKFMNEV